MSYKKEKNISHATRNALVPKNKTTVKLGYNELGFNEHSVITNEYFGPKSPFST